MGNLIVPSNLILYLYKIMWAHDGRLLILSNFEPPVFLYSSIISKLPVLTVLPDMSLSFARRLLLNVGVQEQLGCASRQAGVGRAWALGITEDHGILGWF